MLACIHGKSQVVALTFPWTAKLEVSQVYWHSDTRQKNVWINKHMKKMGLNINVYVYLDGQNIACDLQTCMARTSHKEIQ